MKILITGGHVVDPANEVDREADVGIADGRIRFVGDAEPGFSPDRTIDASGRWVLPGLVDLCARLREPGEEQKATIASETAAAAAGGITGLVCPPDTWPVVDTPAMANMIRDRAESGGFSRVHPLGALTVGLAGERLTDMAMLADAGCVGVSNGLRAVENTLIMRRAMQYASTFDIPVFLSPQDPWLMGNGVVHEGEISTRLGLPAIPEAAETVGVARDLALIETSGARSHISLLSCARSVGMVREARESGLPVSVSVAIHQLLLTERNIGAFDTRYKVIPPLRTETDRDALVEGVLDGTIDVICSDHQPHGADAKLAPFGEAATGIAGLESLLPLTLSLVRSGVLPRSRAVAALTASPARVIGIDAGHLTPGGRADICVVDPEHRWRFMPETMKSRGRNSPFIGEELVGRVEMTLASGRPTFELEMP